MQRVAIARALVNNPTIIFADEPTGNLDSKTGEIVLETFKNLNKQGRTIILITHEKYIAERAERTISLKDGEIIEDVVNHRSKTVQQIKGQLIEHNKTQPLHNPLLQQKETYNLSDPYLVRHPPLLLRLFASPC